MEPASWLTSGGDSPSKSGWKPLKSWVRSSAGVVRESGMVSPGRNVRPTGPAPWSRSTYRWPTMLRYLMEAVTEAGRSRPLRTAKATSASRRSATRTDCT